LKLLPGEIIPPGEGIASPGRAGVARRDSEPAHTEDEDAVANVARIDHGFQKDVPALGSCGVHQDCSGSIGNQ